MSGLKGKPNQKLWQKSAIFLVEIAMLSAISSVIYIFMDFHIFPGFPMFKLDFAEVPVLLGGFALGPVAAVAIEAIKVLIGILATGLSWGGVGDFSNFLVNISFVVPAAILYRRFHSRKGAFAGLGVGNLCLYLVSCLSNAFIMLPLVGLTEEPLYTTTIFVGLGFNALKGVTNSLLTILLYKRLSPILKLGSFSKKEDLLKSHRVYSKRGTARLARRLAECVKGGEIILLNGDLGAGKTTFTQYFARALGVKDTVSSPTFTIMKSYDGKKFKLYHFDLYRIEDPAELEELGFEEYLGEPNSVSVVEWNKIENLSGKIYRVDVERIGRNARKFCFSEVKRGGIVGGANKNEKSDAAIGKKDTETESAKKEEAVGTELTGE